MNNRTEIEKKDQPKFCFGKGYKPTKKHNPVVRYEEIPQLSGVDFFEGDSDGMPYYEIELPCNVKKTNY